MELRGKTVRGTEQGAVGQKTGIVNRCDARRYTRQEQSLGADEGRSFSQAGYLRRTTCHAPESSKFFPLTMED